MSGVECRTRRDGSTRADSVVYDGAPGVIRTPDLLVRSQTLYPTELRARDTEISHGLGEGKSLKNQDKPSQDPAAPVLARTRWHLRGRASYHTLLSCRGY